MRIQTEVSLQKGIKKEGVSTSSEGRKLQEQEESQGLMTVVRAALLTCYLTPVPFIDIFTRIQVFPVHGFLMIFLQIAN